MLKRSTKQKTVILDTLRGTGRPLSPQEILDIAHQQVPTLGIATVYRNLKELQQEQQVVAVELPAQATRYELAGKGHHHHFHCNACSRVFELEGCMGDFSRMVPSGFRADSHEVVIYGLCPQCVQQP